MSKYELIKDLFNKDREVLIAELLEESLQHNDSNLARNVIGHFTLPWSDEKLREILVASLYAEQYSFFQSVLRYFGYRPIDSITGDFLDFLCGKGYLGAIKNLAKFSGLTKSNLREGRPESLYLASKIGNVSLKEDITEWLVENFDYERSVLHQVGIKYKGKYNFIIRAVVLCQLKNVPWPCHYSTGTYKCGICGGFPLRICAWAWSETEVIRICSEKCHDNFNYDVALWTRQIYTAMWAIRGMDLVEDVKLLIFAVFTEV